MEPTKEQRAALDVFSTGESMAVSAYAGTGKTSTLVLMAQAAAKLQRRGRYVAFNKAIVEEGRTRFPTNVSAQTAHAMAWQAIVGRRGSAFDRRLGGNRVRASLIAKRLGIDPFVISYGTQKKVLQPAFIASLAQRAVNRFCSTADLAPSYFHVPYVDGIDLPTDDGERSYENNNALQRIVADVLPVIWADINNPDGTLPFRHEHYLKIFELSQPEMQTDFVLYDEAQDVSPVMNSIVERQMDRGVQVVYVGDEYQCQPPGTMVTVVRYYRRGNRITGVIPTTTEEVPIEDIQAGDEVVTYDAPRSFLRRSGAPVTATAVRQFSGQLITVETESGLVTEYTPNHRCVARVAEAMEGKHLVYMMRRGPHFRIGKVAGSYRSQAGMLGLPMRAGAEGADAAWVLSVHDTNREALLQEVITAQRWGIPTLRFKAGDIGGIGQGGLDRFWAEVGNNRGVAARCLAAFDRDIEYPLWCPSDANLTRRRSSIVRACNLMTEMRVLPLSGAMDAGGKQVPVKRWESVKISRRDYTGPVYSLKVAEFHTYVADGIVTGNSIYEWTGAIDALSRAQVAYRTALTQSFRFGDEIAAAADAILQDKLGATAPLLGTSSIAGDLCYLAHPDVLLCRTNAVAMESVLDAQMMGRHPLLLGGGKEILTFATAALELMEKGKTSYFDLACFDSWAQAVEYSGSDPQGDELTLNVNLIEQFGVDTIIAAIGGMPKRESDADLVVSTAHKCKGLEWGSVKLARDFVFKPGADDLPVAEWRLLYVACTRAKHALDVTSSPPMCDLLGIEAEA